MARKRLKQTKAAIAARRRYRAKKGKKRGGGISMSSHMHRKRFGPIPKGFRRAKMKVQLTAGLKHFGRLGGC